MHNYFNIDAAVEQIKVIVDSNRCDICDKLNESRFRFSCGHSVCEQCMPEVNECVTCLITSKDVAVLDSPQTQRVINASNLLKTFQEAFNLDVYERHRLIEKLKVEKQLFPDPINVSVTYYNKRKSSESPYKRKLGKENRESSFFLNEKVSSIDKKMDERINVVHQWLESNENISHTHQRKPFSNLDVNSPLFSKRRNKSSLKHQSSTFNTSKRIKKDSDITEHIKYSRKKSLSKKYKYSNAKKEKSSKEYLSQSLLNNDQAEVNKNQIRNERNTDNVTLVKKNEFILNKYDNESGIVIDDDPIIIEESQIPIVDKDQLALLAVHEASEMDESNHNYIDRKEKTLQTNNKIQERQMKRLVKVPFYKKELLWKTCALCLYKDKQHNLGDERLNISNDMSVTINTGSVMASITVSTNKKHNIKMLSYHTVATQTDSNCGAKKEDEETKLLLGNKNCFLSQDLFFNEPVDKQEPFKIKEVIVEDSDNDDEMNCGNTLEIKADVHRSNDIDVGVLSELKEEDYKTRLRGAGRRHTIDSNNSSEKENIEPNRLKKQRLEKKYDFKK